MFAPGLGRPRIGALLAAFLAASALASCSSSTDLSSSPGEVEITLDRNEYGMGDSIVITARNLGPGQILPGDEALLDPCFLRLERELENGEWAVVGLSISIACATGRPLGPPMAGGRETSQAHLIGVGAGDELWPHEAGYWPFDVGASYRWRIEYRTRLAAWPGEERFAISPIFSVVP